MKREKLTKEIVQERIDKIKEWTPNLCIDFAADYYESIERASGDYISDHIYEYADGRVDIYNGELLKWLCEDWRNLDAVEEATAEFGTPTENSRLDLMQAIRQGQCLQYERELNENAEDMKKLMALYFLRDLDIEKMEAYSDDLEMALDDLEKCDTYSEINGALFNWLPLADYFDEAEQNGTK
jgi:hypothetical protein